jgi:hypothetical protein
MIGLKQQEPEISHSRGLLFVYRQHTIRNNCQGGFTSTQGAARFDALSRSPGLEDLLFRANKPNQTAGPRLQTARADNFYRRDVPENSITEGAKTHRGG